MTTDSRPQRTYRRRALVAAALTGLLVGLGIALAGGYVFLMYALNPMADEWQCSDGEAPADHRSGGAACFAEGSVLPKGYRWDPLGNRPLSYNCNKRGWVEIERIRSKSGETDCMAEGTAMPDGWRAVPD